MPGPVPKKPELRQRRNRAVTSATLVADGRKHQRPRLPRIDGVTWHAMTVAWWREVWRSPMAEEYLRADIHALYRLAVLINQFWGNPSKEMAAEIRLQQQAFGLTPIDRRRLQWEVERVEEVRTRRRTVRDHERGDESDPRAVLKVLEK